MYKSTFDISTDEPPVYELRLPSPSNWEINVLRWFCCLFRSLTETSLFALLVSQHNRRSESEKIMLLKRYLVYTVAWNRVIVRSRYSNDILQYCFEVLVAIAAQIKCQACNNATLLKRWYGHITIYDASYLVGTIIGTILINILCFIAHEKRNPDERRWKPQSLIIQRFSLKY